METGALYEDKLVRITESGIILNGYYFPSMRPKEILFSSIQKIAVKRPRIMTGKWRFHGTGDFRTWFPLDQSRNKRDRIFSLYLSTQRMRAGFTVEDSGRVLALLRGKGLPVEVET